MTKPKAIVDVQVTEIDVTGEEVGRVTWHSDFAECPSLVANLSTILGEPDDVPAPNEVMAIGRWKTNAEVIADVAKLGYLDGSVLDLSWGKGGFWKQHRPAGLVTNDLNSAKGAQHSQDARSTTWPSRAFDSVVWDPPYKTQGTPQSGEMDERFGTTERRTEKELLDLLCDGITEAARLARRFVLVKCQDMVCSGRVVWQTDEATGRARQLGLEKVDSFMLQSGRPQPEGRAQVHARRNYSTLLVFGVKDVQAESLFGFESLSA